MPSPDPPTASPPKAAKATKAAKVKGAVETKRKGKKRASAMLEEVRGEGEDVTMVDTEDSEEAKKAGEDVNKGDGNEKGKGRWGWTSIIDPMTSSQPAVFSKDGRFFFLPTTSSINVHSTATGQVLSTLVPPPPSSSDSDKEPKAHITSLALNPSNPFQLISSSLDGRIIVWDYLDGVPLRIVDMKKPVTHMCMHDTLKDQVLVATNEVSKKKFGPDGNPKPRTRLYRVRLQTQTKQPIGTTPLASFMAMSPSGSHFVVTSGFSCYVHTISADGQTNSVKYSSMDIVTCLAFHPEEEWFATGDAAGVIRYWYCVSENAGASGQLPTTSHAWHAHPVQSLAFTPNGAYLLSGGEEGVVVAWQIQSGRKEFVPRVGGPIRWLSVKPASNGNGEEEWLAGLADRTLVWISSGGLKVSRTIARVKLDLGSLPKPLPSSIPLAYHASTSNLILPSSHPSFLQVYAHSTRTLVSELEVHPSNRVSRRNPDDAPLPAARVDHVALSSGGEWMATIDSRRGGQDVDLDIDRYGVVTRLKVWKWDAKAKEWTLNTRVERPHGAHEVVSVVFQPLAARGGRERQCLLATAGRDGYVKTWKIKVGEGKGAESLSWVSRSSFSYRSHTPAQVSFSPDGSILAVAQGPCVTLWDSQTNVLRRVLTTAAFVNVERVAFIGPYGRWLASLERRPEGERGGSKMVLVLWDLLSCSAAWEHGLGDCKASVVPHPKEASFVVFSSTSPKPEIPDDGSTRALLFNSASSRPFRIQDLPFSLRDVLWYPMGPSSTVSDDFELVGITEKMDIILFGDSVQEAVPAGPQRLGSVSLPAARTLFQDVFGSSALVDLSSATPPSLPAGELSTPKTDDAMFAAPAYLLPPMSTLFGSFMEGIIQHRAPPPPHVAKTAPEPKDKHVDRSDAMDVDLPKRVVDEAEVNMLVEMFKEQMSHGPSSQGMTSSNPSSTPKSNGAKSPATHANGASYTSARGPGDVQLAVEESTEQTPASSGKSRKRKKSTA